MRLAAAALVCASLAPSALYAQSSRLVGRVSDRAGTPLVSASVTLTPVSTLPSSSPDSIAAIGTVTDAAGQFAFAGLAAGRYRLRVGYIGYASVDQVVVLSLNQATELILRLDAAALMEDEVVVDGLHRVVETVSPVTASTLTAREIAQLPDVKDLPASLASQPSTTFYSENGNGFGYTYLRLRGFDERRVAVSLNGQPMNDPEDHSVYWINFMDLQGAITDVQIQRGAGAALYGSAGVGGAVNIVADPFAPTRYAAVETGYGTYNTVRLTAEGSTGLLGGRWIGYARVSRLQSDGYRDHSWAEMTRVMGGVSYLGTRSRLTVQAFGGPQRDALAYYGVAKSDNDVDSLRRANYGAVSNDLERFHQPFVDVRHELQLRPDLRLETNAYATQGEGYFDFDATWRSADYLRLPSGFDGLSAADRQRPLYAVSGATAYFRAYVRNRRAGLLPRLVYTPTDGLFAGGRLVLGADLLAHRSLHWGRIQDGTGLPSANVGDGAPTVYRYTGGKEHAAVYGSALLRPHARVAVQADLSVRHLVYRLFDEDFRGTDFAVPYTFVTPRLGVTVNPERPVRGYASVAYVAREPRLKNFYDADEAGAGATPLFERSGVSYDFAKPLVRPETGVNVEVGASVEGGRGRASVTGYGLWMNDEIVASGGLDQFGVPRTGNAERTRHLGVEVEAAATLVPGVIAEGSATVSDDRFVRFTEYDDNAAPLDRSGHRIALFPAASFRAALRVEPSGKPYGLRIDVQGAGVQPTTNAGTSDRDLVVDPYALVNAGAWYRLDVPGGGDVRLRLDVNNVLDARVLTFGNSGGFFPAAIRHVFAGLRYTLR